MSRLAIIAVGVLAYFLIWLLPRFPAVIENTLHMDDFWIGVPSWSGAIPHPDFCKLPPQDFRWFSMGFFCLENRLLPGWLLSGGPKIVSGFGLSLLAILNYRVVRGWGVPRLPAALIPLVWLMHPIVNEISLWNTTVLFPITMCLVVFAWLIQSDSNSSSRTIAALVILLLPLLTYEVYAILFLVLVVLDALVAFVFLGQVSIARMLRGGLIFALASVLYVVQVLLTAKFFGEPSGRGIAFPLMNPEFFLEKTHAIFNLVVNVPMPVIGYYFGLEVAWSLWKWVFVLLVIIVSVRAWQITRSPHKAVIMGTGALLTLVLPTMWVFFSSQSPESWRVSFPVLMAFSLILATAFIFGHSKIQEASPAHAFSGQLAGLGLLIALLVPVTMAESRLRVFENSLDAQIAKLINSYWEGRAPESREFAVAVVRLPGITVPGLGGAPGNLSVAYHPRGLISALEFDFSWRGFLATRGIQAVEIGPAEIPEFQQTLMQNCSLTSANCKLHLHNRAVRACTEDPDFIQKFSGVRVVHLYSERVSIVCV